MRRDHGAVARARTGKGICAYAHTPTCGEHALALADALRLDRADRAALRRAIVGPQRRRCVGQYHHVPPRPSAPPRPRPRPQHTHTLGELRVRAPRGLAGLRSDCLGPAVMTQCGAAGKLALWVTHNGSTVPTKAACTLEFRAAWSLCRAPYSRKRHPYCDNTHPYSRKCTLIPEIHTLSNDNTHRCSRNTHPYSALPCSSR